MLSINSVGSSAKRRHVNSPKDALPTLPKPEEESKVHEIPKKFQVLGLSSNVLRTIKSVIKPKKKEAPEIKPGEKVFTFNDLTGKSSPKDS